MSIISGLQSRSQSECELCAAANPEIIYQLPPAPEHDIDKSILICQTCHDQITGSAPVNAHHWRCLTDSMWSEIPAVQVVAWRMLEQLSASQTWARDQLDMLYLDEETLAWAQAGIEKTPAEDVIIHRDGNGTILNSGDTVTLIKDLNVKGAGFTAKRGTSVSGISLVKDNAGQLEGRINGQQIVILTQFVKKSV